MGRDEALPPRGTGGAGAGRDRASCARATCRPTAGGCSPTSTTRPCPAWTSWPPPRTRSSRARQRARPDRVPVPAGDGERAGRRPRPGARRRPGTAPDVVGSVTSGGTESLILAVKAARDARPEIAAAAAGHAGDRARRVRQGRALPAGGAGRGAGRRRRPCAPTRPTWPPRSGPDTVLVACSAPSYAHGVVDPVGRDRGGRGRGRGALPRGRLLRRLDAAVPAPARRGGAAVRLRPCPGVTSISVDLHKYAYAPKGVSVLLHRDAALRRRSTSRYADWPGYTMVNPVISSTRSGGPIAAAYATLRHLGDDGYLRAGRHDPGRGTRAGRRRRGRRRAAADGRAESTVVCVHRPPIRGSTCSCSPTSWPRAAGTPSRSSVRRTCAASVHLTVTASVAPRVAEFAADLAASVAAARALGPVELRRGHLLACSAPSPRFAEALGVGSGASVLPDRMAVINTLLNAAPPAVREQLLVAFLSLLQRPTGVG